MDGNGRWANKRLLPRVAGHRKGVEAVRASVRAAIKQGVEYLTLFAFSSENWRRPPDEVSILMRGEQRDERDAGDDTCRERGRQGGCAGRGAARGTAFMRVRTP